MLEIHGWASVEKIDCKEREIVCSGSRDRVEKNRRIEEDKIESWKINRGESFIEHEKIERTIIFIKYPKSNGLSKDLLRQRSLWKIIQTISLKILNPKFSFASEKRL